MILENYALLKQLVDELNSTNSTNDKKAILSRPEYDDPFIKMVFVATYNPFVQYYVTPKNLKKNSHLTASSNVDLFTMLMVLSERTVTGHDAIAMVNGYIRCFPGYEELIYNIFDRNLKTRTTSSIINKVHKKLIPVYDIPLAKKYEDHQKKVKFDVDRWWASRKLDGLRCNAIIDHDGNIEMRSRTGNTFHTLDLVIEELKTYNLKGVVFDGEICIVREDGSEDFQAIAKEWNRKDHTIPNPRYKIFDMVALDDFNNKKGEAILSERLDNLKKAIPVDTEILSVVEQTLVLSDEHLEELRAEAKKLGWEGVMIRKDIGYEGKRSDKLLKCKLFEEAEFEVVGTVNDIMRIIRKDGNSKTYEFSEDMMAKAIILYEGEEVGVGSGWSQEERRKYYKNPENLIGNEITVQYFEVSEDKTGKKSLRFPTVKAVWKGKRNV